MQVDLRLGDCLDIMRGLPDASVDAVITDPPYEMYHTQSSESKARLKGNGAVIRLNEKGWAFNHDWIIECARILKDGCAWYVFMNTEGWSSLHYTAIENGLKPMQRLVWAKTNSMPSIPRRNYRNSSDLIMYGIKGKRVAHFYARNQQEIRSYFEYPVVCGRDRTEHPTQKPIDLIETFVRISSLESATILDPFMGSGTTGVACVKLNRNFIGIEINPDYFKIAERRIKEAQEQMTMVLHA